jgi:hypothetical protein
MEKVNKWTDRQTEKEKMDRQIKGQASRWTDGKSE